MFFSFIHLGVDAMHSYLGDSKSYSVDPADEAKNFVLLME